MAEPGYFDEGDLVAVLTTQPLDRMLDFYCGLLGFELTQRYGTQAAFVAAGGYHHHIGFNTWESAGGKPPPAGTTGLYHLAILYPERRDLADALSRLAAAGVTLDGASDHGVSEALYLSRKLSLVIRFAVRPHHITDHVLVVVVGTEPFLILGDF